MGILSNTRELKEDVLFRASEPLTGSKYEPAVLRNLNRVYRTLATGASEFLPEYVEDWWWLRGRGVFNLEPTYRTGSVLVNNNSTSITFTPAPAISLQDRRLLIDGAPSSEAPAVPIIATHTAGAADALLDAPWTGDTNTLALFDAMKVLYSLALPVQVIMSPMSVFTPQERIIGVSPERIDELYPVARMGVGCPQAFALQTETSVRFSHGGSDEGDYIRVEYEYRPKIDDLTDSLMSIPAVPAQWMHLLSDMALVYILMDKNDDRSNAVALAARTGLGAMLKENRRRLVKMDVNAGKIIPRQDKVRRDPGKTYPTL